MRITEHELWVFFAGATIGSIVTYRFATREKRIILRIRENICFLGYYHKLTFDQSHQTARPEATLEIASDQEVFRVYRWAERRVKGIRIKKISPTLLAAEEIICGKLLGLTGDEAASAVTKSLEELLTLPTVHPPPYRHRDPTEPIP
jgi:hypothetical protein